MVSSLAEQFPCVSYPARGFLFEDRPVGWPEIGGVSGMGTFHTRIGVANPEVGEYQWVDALVDTGATYTMLPASFLDQILGLTPQYQQNFRIADGTMRSYQLGEARFRLGERSHTSPVVFGPEDRCLLGAITLQTFGLIADTTHHQLIPAPELTL